MHRSDAARFSVPMLTTSVLSGSLVAGELLRDLPWAFAAAALMALPLWLVAGRLPSPPRLAAAVWEGTRAALLLLHFCVFLSTTALPATPLLWVALPVFALACAFAASGAPAIARLCRLIWPALAAAAILIFLVRPSSFSLARMPAPAGTERLALKAAAVAVFVFARVPLLCRGYDGARTAAVTGALLLSALLALPLLLLGPHITAALQYPLYHAANLAVARLAGPFTAVAFAVVICDAGLGLSYILPSKELK